MAQILIFLHFVGLMIGAAGGFGSAIAMRRAASLPEAEARTLRALGPVLANVSAAGLVLLWLTGLAMVWAVWPGLLSLPWMFWVKFLFVLSLTAAIGLQHRAYALIRRGNTDAAAQLPVLGPVAGLSSLAAVLFAVIAFAR